MNNNVNLLVPSKRKIEKIHNFDGHRLTSKLKHIARKPFIEKLIFIKIKSANYKHFAPFSCVFSIFSQKVNIFVYGVLGRFTHNHRTLIVLI